MLGALFPEVSPARRYPYPVELPLTVSTQIDDQDEPESESCLAFKPVDVEVQYEDE